MRISRAPLLAFVLAASATPLAAQMLTPYDVFVFQDFSHTHSETNGRIAIGGNATLTHWAVGEALAPGFMSYSLVVGHNLTSDEGSVLAGRTWIGGALSATSTSFPAYAPEFGGLPPVDFAAEAVRLTGISNAFAAMGTTGSIDLTAGELSFVGTSSYNVFSLTMAMLQSGTAGYEFVTPFGATNIINVLGSAPGSAFNNTAFFFDCANAHDSGSCLTGSNEATPADAARTLWNFNEQDVLDIGGPVHGSVLAPNAAVTFGIGDVVGNVVAKSADARAEFYSNHFFAGPIPSVVTGTPEPSSIMLVATGLVALVGAGFRSRKTVGVETRSR